MEGSSNGGMLYHEVQESKLCAVHCVNTALQGPFFLEFDFAALASELDLQGLTRMKKRRATCECGTRETTAELAASLSVSAARRIVEADEFMRAGLYDGWLPNLFVGNLLKGLTVGVIGAGRIGSAYARMMVEGFKMNLIFSLPHV